MDLGDMIQQCTEDSVQWFPNMKQDPAFLTLCLAGEVGETANLIKKVVRGSVTWDEAIVAGLPEEIIDILVYLCNLMGHETFKDIDWEEVWNSKRTINEARFANVL